jgi:hypothetical protein
MSKSEMRYRRGVGSSRLFKAKHGFGVSNKTPMQEKLGKLTLDTIARDLGRGKQRAS